MGEGVAAAAAHDLFIRVLSPLESSWDQSRAGQENRYPPLSTLVALFTRGEMEMPEQGAAGLVR